MDMYRWDDYSEYSEGAVNDHKREVRKTFHLCGIFLLFAVLLTVLRYPENVRASVKDGMPFLCSEDEVIIILNRDQEFSIYDCRGNKIGKWRTYGDVYSASIVDRDTVMAYRKDDAKEVFSFRTMGVLLSFPAEDYLVAAEGKHVLAVNKKTGLISFYDSSGTLLFEGEGPVSEREWGPTMKMIRLQSGWVIYSAAEEKARAVYVGNDGMIKEIVSDVIKKGATEGYIQAFGENLYITYYDDEMSFVADFDGVHLLDDIEDCLYSERTQTADFYERFSWYLRSPDFVMQETDGMYVIYDKNLSVVGQVPTDPEDDYYRPETSGGYVAGIPYRELLGKTCDGFVECGSGKYPYAQMNNGCLVFWDDIVVALPVPAGETLVSFSEAYFVTKREDETVTDEYGGHPTIRSVWRRDDGSLFLQNGKDGNDFHVNLSETGLSIFAYGVPDEYSSTQYLYNNQYELAFPPGVNTYLRPFKNGYWYTNRGVYTGIIDVEGNWVVREIAWEE